MDALFGYRVSVLRNFVSIMLTLLRLSPLLLRLGFCWLFLDRLKSLTYLKVLRKVICCKDHSSGRPIIFDQGPVFLQTFVLAIGSSFRPKECLKSWVARDVSDWSSMLKGIVWLEAVDATLLTRVHQREQTHWLETRTPEKKREFMCGFRFAYDQVISMYEQKGVPVLRLTTESNGVDVTESRIVQFVSEIESGVLPNLDEYADCGHIL